MNKLLTVIWFSFWALLSENTLLIQMRETSPVPFSQFHMSWTYPWAQGCLWKDIPLNSSPFTQIVTWCYGTNFAHFGGPYSILWYWIMMLCYSTGYGMAILWTISWPIFFWKGFTRPRVVYVYAPSMYLFLVAFPQNVIILWFLILGFRNKWFSIFGALVKWPLAPLPVIIFAFSQNSLGNSENWGIYGLLAIWFLAPFFRKQVSYVWDSFSDLFSKKVVLPPEPLNEN